MRPRGIQWLWMAPLAIVAGIVFIIVGSEIVLHLWNWLLPSLFGLRTITFWQALGILVLSRILFGGCGFRGASRRSHWRHRMEERCKNMTPEEREKFRQRM